MVSQRVCLRYGVGGSQAVCLYPHYAVDSVKGCLSVCIHNIVYLVSHAVCLHLHYVVDGVRGNCLHPPYAIDGVMCGLTASSLCCRWCHMWSASHPHYAVDGVTCGLFVSMLCCRWCCCSLSACTLCYRWCHRQTVCIHILL